HPSPAKALAPPTRVVRTVGLVPPTPGGTVGLARRRTPPSAYPWSMPIRRLATPDSIIEALLPLMRWEPVLSYEEATAALLDSGLNFGDEADAVQDALDNALDFGAGCEELFLVDDWIVHPAALAAAKVFTHRITADDLSGEVIPLFPDCAPWLPALTYGLPEPTGTPTLTGTPEPTRTPELTGTANPTGTPELTGTPDPTGGPGTESAASSAPDDSTEDETDAHLGTAIKHVHLAVGDADPVRAELIGLGTLDDSGAMLILPEGALAELGVREGDLVTLRLRDGTIHLYDLPGTPTAAAPGSQTPADAGSPDSATPDSAAVVADHLRRVQAETTLLESLAEFLFRCMIADRAIFDTPTAPLTELLDAADIHPEGDLVGEITEEASANIREHHVTQAAARYDLKRHEARLLLDLVDALSDYQLDDAVVDADIVTRGWAKCADAWFAFAVAEEALVKRALPDAVEVFAALPSTGAPRAVRGGLHFLRGRLSELAGDPVGAIADYRKAAELHESPFALQRLAQLEFYRGDYTVARSLLDQSGAADAHPLYEDLTRATRHTLPAEPTRKLGRNEPCWCGSGRKFKVCHGRAGAGAPLSHRAPGLYDRATAYVFDAAPGEVTTLLNFAVAAAGGPVPEQGLVPIIVDLLLIEDHLMADFAETYAAILPDDEVMVLEQWHLEANRSVFDVEAVVPGAGMTLRDLRTGDRYEVVERSGSQQVQVGWFLCTRVADVAGQYQLFGGIEPVALNQREALMELLDSSPTARDLTVRLAARFAPTAILSPEGDPMVMCEARYAVGNPNDLRAVLDELFESEAEPAEVADADAGDGARDGAGSAAGGVNGYEADEWMWSEVIDADQHRVLASLTLTGEELVIRTSTEQRLERVLALLDSAGADLVETTVERLDAAEMMRAVRAGELEGDDEFADDVDLLDDDPFGDDAGGFTSEDIDRPAPGLSMSPEDALAHPEVAAAVATMIAGYEKRWLDESIPALSGLTPRQAAADPTRRDDLIRLLDTFPATGSPHQMDGDRLRAALGL
ncbi:MAG: hypothetical protein QG597_4534, partial [Actinomycetota bacterium]|nr:hypothetical protein [Actinomycetota bacterium]